jgi:hypothetical protein
MRKWPAAFDSRDGHGASTWSWQRKGRSVKNNPLKIYLCLLLRKLFNKKRYCIYCFHYLLLVVNFHFIQVAKETGKFEAFGGIICRTPQFLPCPFSTQNDASNERRIDKSRLDD